jgi:hypothetical protein
MSAPTVVIVASGAGINRQPAQQIPIGESNEVTLLNLSTTQILTLCNDQTFNPGITWPLLPGEVLSLTSNNIWVQNPSLLAVSILVINGIVPITFNPAAGLSVLGGISLCQAQNVTYAGNTNPLMPAPPIGTAYRLQKITIVSNGIPPIAGYINISANAQNVNGVLGSPSNLTLPQAIASGVQYQFEKELFGLLISTAISATIGPSASMTTTFFIQINYDIVPLGVIQPPIVE